MARRMDPLSPDVPPERAELAIALRELRGRHTMRDVAEQCQVRPGSVSRILAGKSLASWNLTSRIITACGGDPSEYEDLWVRAERADQGRRGTPQRMSARITVLEMQVKEQDERIDRLERLVRNLKANAPRETSKGSP